MQLNNVQTTVYNAIASAAAAEDIAVITNIKKATVLSVLAQLVKHNVVVVEENEGVKLFAQNANTAVQLCEEAATANNTQVQTASKQEEVATANNTQVQTASKQEEVATANNTQVQTASKQEEVATANNTQVQTAAQANNAQNVVASAAQASYNTATHTTQSANNMQNTTAAAQANNASALHNAHVNAHALHVATQYAQALTANTSAQVQTDNNAQASAQTSAKKVTNAMRIREQIALLKASVSKEECIAQVIAYGVTTLGQSKALAKKYVTENYDKVKV